jgi:hypothetical protein
LEGGKEKGQRIGQLGSVRSRTEKKLLTLESYAEIKVANRPEW